MSMFSPNNLRLWRYDGLYRQGIHSKWGLNSELILVYNASWNLAKAVFPVATVFTPPFYVRIEGCNMPPRILARHTRSLSAHLLSEHILESCLAPDNSGCGATTLASLCTKSTLLPRTGQSNWPSRCLFPCDVFDSSFSREPGDL